MNLTKEHLNIFNELLNGTYERKNAGEKIFSSLKKLLHFENACIFYIGEDLLTPVYCSNFSEEKVKPGVLKGLKKYVLKQQLFAEDCPFALLVISDDEPYNNFEKEVFKTASLIISGILKNIEITEIMNLQINALQDGIVEINNFNKVIKEQNKKILEADRVKSKFLSNVSHELRSPLNSIIGFSDFLITENPGRLNKKQKEYLDDIRIAGTHLLGMVNEILDLSKIESHAVKLSPSLFELSLCVNEVLNILKPLYLKKEISVENRICEDFKITADYQKLQQIFFNIINNAIKFTPEKGCIKISSKILKKYIQISIEDNGIGIAPKDRKKIFRKFEQLNQNKNTGTNSTGLGLTITKELVKLHKGTIKVEGGTGKGSVFLIKLPLK